MEPDDAPTHASAAIALAWAALAAVLAGAFATVVLAVGLAGAGLVAAALARRSRPMLSLGAAVLVAGAFVSGLFGAPVVGALLAGTAAVLAWDAGSTALSLGRQLGRPAATLRVELLHAATSAAVGLGVVSFGVLVLSVAAGARTVTAVVLLIAAAALLLLGLTPRGEEPSTWG